MYTVKQCEDIMCDGYRKDNTVKKFTVWATIIFLSLYGMRGQYRDIIHFLNASLILNGFFLNYIIQMCSKFHPLSSVFESSNPAIEMARFSRIHSWNKWILYTDPRNVSSWWHFCVTEFSPAKIPTTPFLQSSWTSAQYICCWK